MQRNSQLAALLVALCSSPAFAGGGGAGNGPRAANYTGLAAQLSALRLSNSSDSSANSTGQGHSRVLHSASADPQLGRFTPRRHSKKTTSVMHGKKGNPARTTKQAAQSLPSHQRRNNGVPPRPHPAYNGSRTGDRSRKVHHTVLQQPASYQSAEHSGSKHSGSASRPQALYRQNHRGYVLETRRQLKRREALENSTPLYTSNFTDIRCDYRGHYHLAEDIDLGTDNPNLPLCNGQEQAFQGTLKGGHHTLSLNGSEALFNRLWSATLDVRLANSRLQVLTNEKRKTGLLANTLYTDNSVSLAGGSVEMQGNAHTSVLSSIESGTQILKQNDFHAVLSGRNMGGAIGYIGADKAILTQADSTFRLTNLISGGGGISTSEETGRLFLTQTNVKITEEGSAAAASGNFGGGLWYLVGGSSFLTQTAVTIDLQRGSEEDVGATFGAAFGATITLRLFSGTSTAKACGTIGRGTTVQGVIDTAGYTANTSSCQSDNQSGLGLLDSTQADHWRQAYQEFCCSDHAEELRIACPGHDNSISCHYPHEQLLATVPAGTGSVLLLSRQRYPLQQHQRRTRPAAPQPPAIKTTQFGR